MLKSGHFVALGLLATGIAMPAFAEDKALGGAPSSVLSLEEYARASQIAAPRATSRAFNLDPNAPRTADDPEREVVSNVQAVGVGKSDARLAIVTLYRYDGNTSINRLIDIDTGRVVSEERIQNSVAPLADVEVEYATDLLRQNERIRALLASLGDGTSFSFRLITATDQDNPLFGKRVLAAAINTPDGYVGGAPAIHVNLTDGAVTVQD